MELRQYLEIIRDRAAVVIGTFLVALVAAAASVYLVPQATSTYSAVLTIAVLPQPLPQSATLYFSDDYYSYVASEYANDDLIAVLQSDLFMQGIRARLPNAPSGSISATKAHRVVNISVGSGTAAGATALAQAVADALLAPDAEKKYFSLLTNRNVTVSVVDGPRLGSQPAGRNALLNLAARALVGLALGIGLAFLLEYLDDSIRPNEAEALLGWPILAEVPGRGLPRTG
ncbi:MAG TPA: hypothetical protein VIO35_06695 [Chloroflexota bacterium]